MAKKYKKKRKYNSYSNGPDLLGAIVQLIMMILVFSIITGFIYKKQIDNFYLKYGMLLKYGIISLIIGIVIILIILLVLKKNNKKATEEISNEELKNIVKEIKEFKPLRNYSTELPYQTELAGYLKKTFTNLKIEETQGNTRPDIIIENIAIEIKGPTKSKDLQTIADKIIRYLKHYDYIIIVLFNIEISENNFNEWRNDIIENFVHKGDKVYIIGDI